MREFSVRDAIADLESCLSPSGRNFSGDYWILGELAFFWDNPPDGAGEIHHRNGDISFDFPSEDQEQLFRKMMLINGCVEVMCGILTKMDLITGLWLSPLNDEAWFHLEEQPPGAQPETRHAINLLKNGMDDDSWFHFIKSDIHAFHVELRSVFDTIALIIADRLESRRSGKLDSFRKLRDMVSNSSDKKNILPPIYSRLVSECDWFDQMRDLRDAIMHQNKDAWVRWRTDGHIVFALSHGSRLKLMNLEDNACLRHFLWQNLILFAPYAGYYFGRLIAFLNRLSCIVAYDVDLELSPHLPWAPTQEFSAIHKIKHALSILKANYGTASNYADNWTKVFGRSNQ
jgi:hypothetical protein